MNVILSDVETLIILIIAIKVGTPRSKAAIDINIQVAIFLCINKPNIKYTKKNLNGGMIFFLNQAKFDRDLLLKSLIKELALISILHRLEAKKDNHVLYLI